MCKATCSELTGETPEVGKVIEERLHIKKELKRDIQQRLDAADVLVGSRPEAVKAEKVEKIVRLRRHFHERE